MIIRKLEKKDFNGVLGVIDLSLTKAFRDEKISHLKKELKEEEKHKKNIIEKSFIDNDNIFFVIEKDNKIIGVGAFGEVSDFLKNIYKVEKESVEMHTIYLLPEYHNFGFGTKLVDFLISEIKKNKKIKNFVLYAGFKKAQKFWKNKFGEPKNILKDFWGDGGDNYIWDIKNK